MECPNEWTNREYVLFYREIYAWIKIWNCFLLSASIRAKYFNFIRHQFSISYWSLASSFNHELLLFHVARKQNEYKCRLHCTFRLLCRFHPISQRRNLVSTSLCSPQMRPQTMSTSTQSILLKNTKMHQFRPWFKQNFPHMGGGQSPYPQPHRLMTSPLFKARIHHTYWVTDNDSTNLKPHWILSYPRSRDITPMKNVIAQNPNTKNARPNPKTPTPKRQVSGISYIGVLSVAFWLDTLIQSCKYVTSYNNLYENCIL